MRTSGKRGHFYVWGGLGSLLCVAGLLWTMWAMARLNTEDPAGGADPGTTDTAAILSFLLGAVGTSLGVWSLGMSVHGLRIQRTGPTIAAELTHLVRDFEGRQYRQLLGGDEQALNAPADLRFTLASTTPGHGLPHQGSLSGIATFYRSLPSGRLVITGDDSGNDAGVGKTVLAVALILGLSEDRRAGPVPVRLSAAGWPGGTVRDWLRTHLTRVYNLKEWEAQKLVDEHLILPVIDGLDEMDNAPDPDYISRAARLLREVERFERPGAKAPVVLTCRRDHYDSLAAAEAQPQTAARIEIARMGPSEIRTYLKARLGYSRQRVIRWQPVLDSLATPGEHGPSALARALDTPWRVTLAAVVYEERDLGRADGAFVRDPADLVSLADRGELYEHLLDRYITAAVHAPGAPVIEPDPDDEDQHLIPAPALDPGLTWRRLSVLAAYLNANAAARGSRSVAGQPLPTNDLVLHALWPLAGIRRARLVGAALATGPFSAMVVWLWLSGVLVTGLLVASAAICVATVTAGAMVEDWPVPRGILLRRIRTRAGRRRIVRTTLLGLGVGLVAGLMFRVAQGAGHQPRYVVTTESTTFDLNGMPATLTVGTAVGLVVAFTARNDATVTDPRDAVRGDLSSWLGVWFLLGALAMMPGLDFAAEPQMILVRIGEVIFFGALIGVLFGLSFGLLAAYLPLLSSWFHTFGLRLVEAGHLPRIFTWYVRVATFPRLFAFGGSATVRYVAFLLCMRGRLPWRLGRFLDQCYRIGLLRIAGTAYQFRHRELQDHLAHRHQPPH
ncbi:NACHT domain-containing protein [Streptomyces smyrnaeus]|uniref:NACHT domain-containing protein n=1 Tax=Streptomyces smyrnaeus TaxID=1387713 RepID=UPI0037B21A49